MLGDLRERWSTAIVILRPYALFLFSFVGWPIPVSLLLIWDFSLQNIPWFSLWPGFLNWVALKVRKRARVGQRYFFWKILNAVFLSFVNLLSFHYKRHNQNRADSTVNNSGDLLNLLVHSWIYEKRTLHVTVVPCLHDFIFNGNANCVTGPYHAWRFGDRFFAFNCCKEDQIIQ